ncbi:Triple functional domain protein-like Protein [Tribolium castaneum]|uniref:Triple functional domain protein-like Protein n=1 Tax=Tribolium castaneum TaxID=7070 RepID=A0A139WLW8_TRICA|nr:Triple functional domain protein-like Protein [Tribolium castaneum]
MSNPSGSSTGVVPKSQKAKRKISLPWFRQGSVAQPHPTLTRQHTIDTPSSFQARLLRRQPSQSALAGVLEMTWVVSDFTATCPQELSVTKGQQVEVVEVCSSKPDYCLVRMPTRGTDHDSSVPEGLVPLAVLKQPPAPRSSPSRRAPLDHELVAQNLTTDKLTRINATSNDTTGTVNTSSPVNKRRGFSGRKWLPPPLRKLSQGKVDKTQSTALERPPLKKTGSDKRIKVPSEMGNKPSVSEGEDDEDRLPLSIKNTKSLASELTNGGGEDADEEVELPPPMKPIQEPIVVTSTPPGVPDIEENPCKRVSSLTLKSLEGATSADLAEIEQIVKERMEQHSENQERNSGLRDTKSADAISDCGDQPNTHRELSARCSSNEATASAFSGDESDKPSEDNVDSAKKTESLLRKRQFVLQELVDTEEAYVRDLSLIVDGYMATMKDPECEIPMPEDLRDGKDKMVFGNIEAIYDWHKDIFLKSLKKAIENPTELAQLFRRYERKLHMYVVYCKNKPVSEYIVSEYLESYFEELRVKLGHKLQLCDLLIKPVQRIMKYQLMLKDILKYTERAGLTAEAEPLRTAYQIMVDLPKAANDMMDVGRLQGFDGKITAQGKLLLHGPLTCTDVQGTVVGKNKDLQVFLFEQSIILSDVVGKKTQFTSPQYIYKTHIQVNKMNLHPEEDGFVLTSTDPHKPALAICCQAATQELQEQWFSTIKNILQTQRDFLKAIQSPIAYQKELTKEASVSDASTLWDPSPLRKTVSIPITPDSSKHRKNIHYIHKANTIGIPSESDLSDASDSKVPNHSKTRVNFFEGFRNTLRSKHKSDPTTLEIQKDSDKNDMQRRWSEANQPTVS